MEVNADHVLGSVETAEHDFRAHASENGLFVEDLQVERSNILSNAYFVYTDKADRQLLPHYARQALNRLDAKAALTTSQRLLSLPCMQRLHLPLSDRVLKHRRRAAVRRHQGRVSSGVELPIQLAPSRNRVQTDVRS